jgi:hypothetical protein
MEIVDDQVGASLHKVHVRQGGGEGEQRMLNRGGLCNGAVYHQKRHSAREQLSQDGGEKLGIEEESASCGECRK